MIGLIGAHRTGKTTLAKRFSEQTGIPFITSSASVVFAELGLDVGDDYPFDARLRAQHVVLERMCGSYQAAGGEFVTDRTPVDALAYTLADIRKNNITGAQEALYLDYAEACYRALNANFFTTLLVPPGLPYVVEEGKPPLNLAYQEHVHSLMFGLIMDEKAKVSCTVISRGNLSIEGRLDSLTSLYNGARVMMDEMRNTQVFH